jgi:hypothetical protein
VENVQEACRRMGWLASLEHLGAAVVVPSGWTHSAIGEITQTHPKAVLALKPFVAVVVPVAGRRGAEGGAGGRAVWCRRSQIAVRRW